jgi:hypothetical protein
MKKATNQNEVPATLVGQLSVLSQMPMNDLKALWRKLFNSEPPTSKRPYLERRIGYQLQENAYREHNPTLLDMNKQRLGKIIDHVEKRSAKKALVLEPGTTLVREYKEIEHRVTVNLDGTFQYEGVPYNSLSEVARLITGTRWSGPLFFGLKSTNNDKKKFR